MTEIEEIAKRHQLGRQQALLAVLVILITPRLANGVSIEKDLSMSSSEKQVLDTFRDRVTPLLYKDYMKSDIYLVRWLRARNFNVDDAEKMLKENIRWRQEKKIDSIQTEDFTEMWRDFPATVDTYDKQGRPVGTIEMYDWDIRQAVLSGRGPKVLRYLDMLLDNVTMQVFERQQKGFNVSQWTCLASGTEFSMIRQGCPRCIPYWVQFLNSLENHFPGWLNEFIVVDAPVAVNTIFSIMKPFMSQQHTRDAIKVFGPNKRSWMAYLDERISRSQRHPAYGGSKPYLERN